MTESSPDGPVDSRRKALFSNAQAAIVEYVFRNGEPIIEAANPRFEEIFDFEEETVVGQSVDEFIVPPENQPEATDLNEKVRRGEPLSAEVQRQAQDGVRTFLLRNAPIESDDTIRGYAIYTDISERKERERELERQYERFRALFENSQAAIVEYAFRDGEPIIEAANPRFEEIFGYDRETVAGHSVDEFIVTPDTRSEATDLNEKVRRGEPLSAEVQREARDGIRTFILRNAPIETELGIRGYASYTDISERKHHERELEAQNERLEKFASIVSHDLRNPLNVAQGYITMVEDEHADVIEENLDRMAAIIEDVLAMARQGEGIDDVQQVDLGELAQDSWMQVETANACLECANDVTIAADPGSCRQLFENLFRNSVEHAGEDVTIRIGALENGFYLEDDGPGIPPEDRNDVFEAGFTTREDGTGFGLNIVAEIAQAHGWTLEATEGTDGGARFEFLMTSGGE